MMDVNLWELANYFQYSLAPFCLLLMPLLVSNWNNYIALTFLILPFYILTFLLFWNAPIYNDRHGYLLIFYIYTVLPPVVGSMTRGLGLFIQSKGWSRIKVLLLETIILCSFLFVVYSGVLNNLSEPFGKDENNILNELDNKKPLEKIE